MAIDDDGGRSVENGVRRVMFTEKAAGDIRALNEEQRAQLEAALLSLMQDPTESNPHVMRLPDLPQRD